MIGWDTNVLLRVILRDDPKQTELADTDLVAFSAKGIRIDRIVLVEAVWVMSRSYRLDRATITRSLDKVMSIAAFQIDARGTVMQAIRRYQTGRADFADYLIAELNEAQCATPTYTFDRAAAEEVGLAAVGSG